ncbi:hypothetical protein C8R46DRAFT_1025093 [Mycena filopes]|nr:hypothetical protein C8R46DRAFT_1025093 [Mycena filopes]
MQNMRPKSPAARFLDMGVGPHDALFSQMGARELLTFKQTCRRAYRLANETCFSLPRLLSPFFGNATEVDRFRRMQLESGTLVSGSIALQFFNRLKWPGSDLDLYVDRPRAELAVRFIVSHDYTFDPRKSKTENGKSQHKDVFTQLGASVAERAPSYLGRGIADVLDFHRGDKKIQLIIATTTPMEIIISFHSTCVMNVISHAKAYALYPQSTFIANQALVVVTAGAGQEAGRQKYADRGWRMIELSGGCDHEMAAGVVRWVGDRFTWTIALPALLIDVPDLCLINSWELKCTPESVAMKWAIIEHEELKYQYIVSPSAAVLAELNDAWRNISEGPAPVDADFILRYSEHKTERGPARSTVPIQSSELLTARQLALTHNFQWQKLNLISSSGLRCVLSDDLAYRRAYLNQFITSSDVISMSRNQGLAGVLAGEMSVEQSWPWLKGVESPRGGISTESVNPRQARIAKCDFLRNAGDKLMKEKNYKEACVKYVTAAAAAVGRDQLPIEANAPFILPEYQRLEPDWPMTDMMECLNGATECLVQLGQYKQNLIGKKALWLTAEVEVVIRNVQIIKTADNPIFEWFDFSIKLRSYFFQRVRARVTAEKIFRSLGNTATANNARLQTRALVPKEFDTDEIRKINPLIVNDRVFALLHPDPTLVASLTVADPTLQVRGSWRKVPVKKGGGITARMGFASFVFEGSLYIFGGQKGLMGPFYRDFWRMDLTALDEWQPLPAYPVSETVTGKLVGFSMVVHDDSAYFFTGRREVDVFNLRTQLWSSMWTSFPGTAPWPYPHNKITDATMQSVDGKLYVFGGWHMRSQVGCTLLMELDIATRVWTLLTGTAEPKVASYAEPGPRRHAVSWVGKDRNKIFVMYGDADRAAALLGREKHGASQSFAHEDLWAWDIAAHKWNQQRLVGNIPSPRTELACVYNPVLSKVLTFGGYAPTALSNLSPDAEYVYRFSYYADTFMLGTDPGELKAGWKHVLTRGFPTYRAQPCLAVDPASGRTFLFGGYVSAEYVPARTADTGRSFSDLWELRLDIPNGHFDDVDVEDEARTARVGPWQRCFACGSTGPWKKCGGACNGQAYFCDGQCLRDGWKEHKLKHKCRK